MSQIHNVKLVGKKYLHWEDLDVDLGLAALGNLEKYPLVYEK